MASFQTLAVFGKIVRKAYSNFFVNPTGQQEAFSVAESVLASELCSASCGKCDVDVFRPERQCAVSFTKLKSLQSGRTSQQGSGPVSLLC